MARRGAIAIGSVPCIIAVADKDYIQDALHRDIYRYRIQTFENFGMTIRAYPTANAWDIFDCTGQWIGFDEYEFEVFSQPPKAMRARLNRKGRVRVWHTGGWRSILSYLDEIRLLTLWDDVSGANARERSIALYHSQRRWWLANQMVFPLLELPAEIREVVYGCVFGDHIEPYPTSRARHLGQNTGFMLDRVPTRNILLTCKQVNVEASNILFNQTPFFVQHHGVLGALTATTPQRTRVRQLVLALSHEDFIRLFGGKPIEDDRCEATRAAYALRLMKLTRLELRIAAPSVTTATGWLDAACQKTVVSWILKQAWPWVRGHPVKVTGFVKTQQKVAFEAACTSEKEHFKLWQRQRVATGEDESRLVDYDEWLCEMDEADAQDGGVFLEETGQEDTFETGPADITAQTPPCFCKTACDVAHWNPHA